MNKKYRTKAVNEVPPGAGVTKLVAEYQQVKKMKEQWEAKEKELKGRILEVAVDEGEEDDKGHVWYALPEEVNGVSRIQRQKRITQVLQEDVVERELKKIFEEVDDPSKPMRTLWEACTTQITVLDEDALLALAYEKKVSEELMAQFYTENVVYAMYLR